MKVIEDKNDVMSHTQCGCQLLERHHPEPGVVRQPDQFLNSSHPTSMLPPETPLQLGVRSDGGDECERVCLRPGPCSLGHVCSNQFANYVY